MYPIKKIKKILSSKELLNFGWLSGDKIVKLLLGLIVGIWVARYLGPDNYGILTFWLTLLGFFEVFASFGTQNVIIKNLVTKKNKNQIVFSAITLRLLLSMIASFAFILSTTFFSTMHIEGIQLILVLILFFRFSEILKYFFESVVQSKYSAWSESLALTISGLLKIFLILTSSSLSFFILAYVFEALLILILMTYFMIKNFPDIKLLFNEKLNFSAVKKLFQESMPFFLASLTVLLYMKIDQLMVGIFLDPTDLGYYAVAVKISEVWYFVPLALISSFFPKLIRYYKDRILFRNLISNLFFSLFWLSILAATTTFLLSDYLINILFGESYSLAAGLLDIYIFSGVFVGISALSDRWYQVKNLSNLIFYKSLSGALLNVLLNYILISSIGIWGAALATIFTLFFLSFIFDIFFESARELLLIKINSLYKLYSSDKTS